MNLVDEVLAKDNSLERGDVEEFIAAMSYLPDEIVDSSIEEVSEIRPLLAEFRVSSEEILEVREVFGEWQICLEKFAALMGLERQREPPDGPSLAVRRLEPSREPKASLLA